MACTNTQIFIHTYTPCYQHCLESESLGRPCNLWAQRGAGQRGKMKRQKSMYVCMCVCKYSSITLHIYHEQEGRQGKEERSRGGGGRQWVVCIMMYVYMYVCKYSRMYVCMYVCMSAFFKFFSEKNRYFTNLKEKIRAHRASSKATRLFLTK